MKEEVSHKGRVTEVNADSVKVEIISSSACASCHAASLCSMSEAVKKVVEVRTPGNENYAVGDEVLVVLKSSLGMKAAAVAYVVPLAVLLVVCVSLSYTGIHELYIGLAGLGSLAVYYLVLYLLRDRMASDYTFCIRKENNLNSIK